MLSLCFDFFVARNLRHGIENFDKDCTYFARQLVHEPWNCVGRILAGVWRLSFDKLPRFGVCGGMQDLWDTQGHTRIHVPQKQLGEFFQQVYNTDTFDWLLNFKRTPSAWFVRLFQNETAPSLQELYFRALTDRTDRSARSDIYSRLTLHEGHIPESLVC